jgi:hypothetical protein
VGIDIPCKGHGLNGKQTDALQPRMSQPSVD